MDLIRDILLAVEASDSSPDSWIELSLPDHSQEEVSYNVELLAEAGFIDAVDHSSFDGHEWHARRLTWTGHDFLDTIRDPEIWRQTKAGAKKAGSWTVELLFAVAKAIGKQKLKETFGIDLDLG